MIYTYQMFFMLYTEEKYTFHMPFSFISLCVVTNYEMKIHVLQTYCS